MRFFSALVAGALAVVAAAQTTGSQPNPFTNTDFSGISTTSVFTITWTPTTPGAVSITLVQGDDQTNMLPVELLVSKLHLPLWLHLLSIQPSTVRGTMNGMEWKKKALW